MLYLIALLKKITERWRCEIYPMSLSSLAFLETICYKDVNIYPALGSRVLERWEKAQYRAGIEPMILQGFAPQTCARPLCYNRYQRFKLKVFISRLLRKSFFLITRQFQFAIGSPSCQQQTHSCSEPIFSLPLLSMGRQQSTLDQRSNRKRFGFSTVISPSRGILTIANAVLATRHSITAEALNEWKTES